MGGVKRCLDLAESYLMYCGYCHVSSKVITDLIAHILRASIVDKLILKKSE